MRYDRFLHVVGALAAAGCGMSGGAWAAEAEVESDTIVVVGSRGAPRLATETSAPVDVFSAEDLAAKGYNELSKALEFLSPSFNYPRASSGPSAQGARPARLRGLGPDQVLVLVNGHRRHAVSIINFNNTAGRGTVPIDFNTIPMAAIERIELLRDGAAAQYGSDAIAGVINIVLKEDAQGGLLSAQYGRTERGQGDTSILRGLLGLPLGADGHFTLSGEINDRDETNAAEIDPRFNRVTSQLGDSAATDLNFALNAGVGPIYGFATVSHRDAQSYPLFRTPTVSPSFYPNGFLPVVNLELTDIGGAFGAKGTLAGWDWDVSNTVGWNKGDYKVSTTVNTSLGAASPTSFYGGGARYGQNIIAISTGRGFDVFAGAHVAAGLEQRHEMYELVAGDALSYVQAGAQGFPGFNPPSPVDVDRDSWSVYIDGELSIVRGLDLGLAVRHENYSDFGDETTGKASLFWRPLSFAAVRATASTGFRAPSLQQQYFSTVTSQRLPNGTLSNVGTFAVTDPVSVALGSSPLKAETSTNFSAGVVLTPTENLSFAVDAYRTDIDDRIALSENISGATVTQILLNSGITNASVARFFTNAADTRSEGIEATARWETPLWSGADLTLTGGYGSFDNDATRIATNPLLPQIPLLGASSIYIMLDTIPRTKAMLDATLDWGPVTISMSGVKWGSNFNATANETQDGPTSVDASIEYRITDRFAVTAGVLNALDAYPPRQPDATGRVYSEVSPLGVNGREYFVRLATTF